MRVLCWLCALGAVGAGVVAMVAPVGVPAAVLVFVLVTCAWCAREEARG